MFSRISFCISPVALLQPHQRVAQVTGPFSAVGRCYKFSTVLQRLCSGIGVVQVGAVQRACVAATQCVSSWSGASKTADVSCFCVVSVLFSIPLFVVFLARMCAWHRTAWQHLEAELCVSFVHFCPGPSCNGDPAAAPNAAAASSCWSS